MLELIFLKLNVEFHVLFFIFTILGCFSYELIIARIGSFFCKFEWKYSIIRIFKLGTIFSKKLLKVGQTYSALNMASIDFCAFWHLLCKVTQNGLQKFPVIGNSFRIENVKICLFSGFEKLFAKFSLSFVVCSVNFSFTFQDNFAQPAPLHNFFMQVLRKWALFPRTYFFFSGTCLLKRLKRVSS